MKFFQFFQAGKIDYYFFIKDQLLNLFFPFRTSGSEALSFYRVCEVLFWNFWNPIFVPFLGIFLPPHAPKFYPAFLKWEKKFRKIINIGAREQTKKGVKFFSGFFHSTNFQFFSPSWLKVTRLIQKFGCERQQNFWKVTFSNH